MWMPGLFRLETNASQVDYMIDHGVVYWWINICSMKVGFVCKVVSPVVLLGFGVMLAAAEDVFDDPRVQKVREVLETDGLDDMIEAIPKQHQQAALETAVGAKRANLVERGHLQTDLRGLEAQAEKIRQAQRLQTARFPTDGSPASLQLQARQADQAGNFSNRIDPIQKQIDNLEAQKTQNIREGKAINRNITANSAGQTPAGAMGKLQKLGYWLSAIDPVSRFARVAGEAAAAWEGTSSWEDVGTKAADEAGQWYVSSKASAVGFTLGSSTGMAAPVAAPVSAFGFGYAASQMHEKTWGKVAELQSQQRHNQRAESKFQVAPEELAKTRAENQARTQKILQTRYKSPAEGRYERSLQGLDEMRDEVRALYAKWDAEKVRAPVEKPVPPVATAVESLRSANLPKVNANPSAEREPEAETVENSPPPDSGSVAEGAPAGGADAELIRQQLQQQAAVEHSIDSVHAIETQARHEVQVEEQRRRAIEHQRRVQQALRAERARQQAIANARAAAYRNAVVQANMWQAQQAAARSATPQREWGPGWIVEKHNTSMTELLKRHGRSEQWQREHGLIK